MENSKDPFMTRFGRSTPEGRLTVSVELDDTACDATFTAMIDSVLKRSVQDGSKVVEFDFAGHPTLASGVLAQLLRLRHQPVEIEIRNASAGVANQLEVTKIDTVIRVQQS